MRRTLHIHVPRTGGTSIDYWARKYLSNSQGIARGLGKLNQSVDFTYIGHRAAGALIDKGYMEKDWFESCYRFAFVRNTWERLVSQFEQYRSYRLESETCNVSNHCLVDFGVFVREVIRDGKFIHPIKYLRVTRPTFDKVNSQLDWLHWGVNFIGRFEKLDDDWEKLCGIVGMDHHPLEKYNIVDHGDYRGYYTAETRDIVAERYAKEIEIFGFKFDGE